MLAAGLRPGTKVVPGKIAFTTILVDTFLEGSCLPGMLPSTRPRQSACVTVVVEKSLETSSASIRLTINAGAASWAAENPRAKTEP